jgi:hypothetical protein
MAEDARLSRPQRLIKQYEEGRLTELEMLSHVVAALAEADVGAFVVSAPPAVLKKIGAFVVGLPKTDEEWSECISLSGAIVTEERPMAFLEEQRRRFRGGVEKWRAYFSGTA